MNRGLLGFGVLLIIIGAVSEVYIVSIIGIFLLFPALLTTPRRPYTPRKETAGPLQTRPTYRPPPPPVSPQADATAAPPESFIPAPQPPQTNAVVSFSPPLFPTSIFPSFTQSLPAGQSKETQATKPERDELLEVGAILALLKLTSG